MYIEYEIFPKKLSTLFSNFNIELGLVEMLSMSIAKKNANISNEVNLI